MIKRIEKIENSRLPDPSSIQWVNKYGEPIEPKSSDKYVECKKCNLMAVEPINTCYNCSGPMELKK